VTNELWLLIVVIATLGCVTWLLVARIHELEKRLSEQLLGLGRNLEVLPKLVTAEDLTKAITSLERSQVILNSAEVSPLSVQMEPYYKQSKQSGIFNKKSSVEIGYQYQLLVNGIPCFEPHVTVVDSREEAEINEEVIARLKETAYQLAQAAVASKTGAAAPLFHVAKAAVKSFS
jgi:hypothetical protein